MEREAQTLVDAASEVTMSDDQRGFITYTGILPVNFIEKHILEAASFWDSFYGNHESKFFKNRKWLTREFNELLDGTLSGDPFASGPEICTRKDAKLRVLEVGCGAGNTVIPILDSHWYAWLVT